jgi:hypothetical protein
MRQYRSLLALAICVGAFIGYVLVHQSSGGHDGLGRGAATRYEAYLQAESEGGGGLLTAFYVAVTGVFLICRRAVKESRSEYDALLCVHAMGALIAVACVAAGLPPSGPIRVAQYFLVTVVILWAILAENSFRSHSRYIIGCGIAVTYVVFFAVSLGRFSSLLPYRVNPVVYD